MADDEKIGKAAGKGDHGGLSPPVSEACLALGGDQGTWHVTRPLIPDLTAPQGFQQPHSCAQL